MLAQLARTAAADLLVRSVNSADPDLRRELRLAFWDLKYLIVFGIPRIPPTPTPFPPLGTNTDGTLDERLGRFDKELLAPQSLVAGDPSPQPSIAEILSDSKAQLTALHDLQARLADALTQTKTEIERLEAVCR